MPQLDFTTTSSQTFWLIIIFFITYIVLVHYFLPNFISSIKTRKTIILENNKEVLKLHTNFSTKQHLINSIVAQNFVKLKLIIEKDFSIFLTKSSLLNLNSIDIMLLKTLYYNTVYYDTIILNSIPLNTNL